MKRIERIFAVIKKFESEAIAWERRNLHYQLIKLLAQEVRDIRRRMERKSEK